MAISRALLFLFKERLSEYGRQEWNHSIVRDKEIVHSTELSFGLERFEFRFEFGNPNDLDHSQLIFLL